MMKKIYLFAIALIVACLVNTMGSQVVAADSTVTVCDDYIVEKYDADTANIYIGESAPSQPEGYTGWIFSGWYTNAECTKAIRENGVTTECYAKFVPEEVLSVKCQTKVAAEGTETTAEKSNLRFVTSIDSTYYSKAGFDISRDGKTYNNETNTSYKRIVASPESGVLYEYSPKVIDTESESFITYTITNIPESYYDTEFLVKPYWITMDNVKVYGVSRYVTVNDYENSVVNIPVKVTASDTNYTTADFHVYESASTTAETESVSVRYRTGEDYASIILSGKTGLSSATKYTVYNSDSSSLLTTFVHRNYDTTYTKTAASMDLSWYTVANEVNSSEDEYVLVTSADLYGFSSLSQEDNFSKKTVYVVADIKVNEGDASTWGTAAPSYTWLPIGRNNENGGFAGRFSGEGHTINGLYNNVTTSSSAANQGLFGKTTVDARIENVRLANTYFGSIGNAMAGIAGQGGGTFDSIYVEEDVYLSTTGQYAGGIIGKLTLDTTITNCWFAGEVTSTDIEAGGIVGRVNGNATATLNYCLNTGFVTGGTSTTKTYSRAAGMCGVIAGTGSLTLNNCLNTGSIDGNGLEQTGSLVGYASGSLTIEDSYATNESYTKDEKAIAVGQSNATVSGYTLYAEEDIQDEGAYSTNLQFDDSETTEYSDGHWLAMVSDTPVLKMFAESNAYHMADTRWYDGTKGTDENPYIIKTVAELYGLAEIVNGGNALTNTYIQLGKNITVNTGNAEDWDETAALYVWNEPIGDSSSNAFAGNFDGAGYTISGLYSVTTNNNIGLFGQITDAGSVKNVTLANTYFSGARAVGAIVGQGGKSYQNILIEQDVVLVATDAMCGGIIGKATKESDITNCYVKGNITAKSEAGGIAGRVEYSAVTIAYCHNEGSVSSTISSGNGRAAGMCGVIAGTGTVLLDNCLNTGTISAADATKQVGSLVGLNNGTLTIAETYATNESCMRGETATAIGIGSGTGWELCSEEELTGENAYANTYLEFDDASKEALFDGHWVITDKTPMLRSFVEDEITNPSYIKADTRWYDGTKGAEKNPYIIYTAEELFGFQSLSTINAFSGETIQLGANITIYKDALIDEEGTVSENVISGYNWTPISSVATYAFAGVFDGNNHTLTGLYCNKTTTNNIGVFGQLGTDAVIKNLNIANTYFSGQKAVATIAGQGGKTFENLSVGEDVTLISSQNMCGGIIGKLTKTTSIFNCEVAATISAGSAKDNTTEQTVSQVGGLVGIVSVGSAEIDNCKFSGSVTASALEVGGIIGQIVTYANISNCYVTEDATILAAKGEVGGIVGDVTSSATSTIKYCLNEGTVANSLSSGNGRTAGVCGVIGSSSVVEVENCLSIGEITSTTSTQVGALLGLIGGNATVTVDDSYAVTGTVTKPVGLASGTLNGTTNTVATAMLSSDNITGENAYNNTWLEFDDASKEALFDGHWVITDKTPMLRSFVEGDITYPSSIKADTRWYDSAETSFTIYTAEELYGFASIVTAGTDYFDGDKVSLGANIIVNSGDAAKWGEDAPTYSWSRIGNGTGKPFKGTFDGCNYTISGLYHNNEENSNVGLFSATIASTIIKNVTIKNTYFKGFKAIGAIAGQGGGKFDTIHVGSDVYLESKGNWCGGIIGVIKTSDSVTTGTSEEAHSFNNCWFEGTLRTERYGGGMTGSVGKWEDDTTAKTRYASNATITNCLNTGTIIHTGATTGGINARTGGLVGALVSAATKTTDEETGETIITATLTSNLTIEDCFCAGSVSSEISGAEKYNSVVGHIFNGSVITCTDVYATRECSEGHYSVDTDYVNTDNVTVTRHFEKQFKGFSGYVNTSGLVYDNTYLTTAGNGMWVAAYGDYPVLKSFSDGYTAVDFSPFVLEGSVVADMVNQGGGNAVITVSGDCRTDYLAKITGDGGLGFEPCYSNNIGSDDKSISTSSYKKDDLVITVSYVAGTNTTYISAGCDVEFSKYLSSDTVVEEGGDTTSGEMSLSMLQLEKAAGSTYIMQLENGHFIIEDGGQTEKDYANFVTYLYKLTGGEKPIIDAWIISHAHVDHFEILNYIDTDGNKVADDFYVQGFYFSQASAGTSNAAKITNRVKLCRTTTETVPEIYRMYTGQTYYFDGVTMEVLLTHEQLTGYTDFNETSVWCKYTIGSGENSQTFLNGADSSTVGMTFMKNAYSADYLYCDIFVALHHGVNTSTDFTNFLEGNSVASGCAVDDVVLYSRMSNPTDSSGYLPDDGSDDESENSLSSLWDEAEKNVQRALLQGYNNDLIGEVKNGIAVNGMNTKYMYYGAGTAKLTFTSEGITGEYITTTE